MLAIRHLEYFLEVAQCGQLVQAAGALGVTPAALSKGIRKVEDELGLDLFERSGQGMRLTSFGEGFVQRAQLLRQAHDEALRHSGDVRAGRAGQIRIGCTMAVVESVVSPVLARLQPRRPMMRAIVTMASSDQVLQQTRMGEVDLAVVPSYGAPAPGLDVLVIGADDLVPVARRGHPLFSKRRLSIADAAQHRWVLPRVGTTSRSHVESVFSAVGVHVPDASVEVDVSSVWTLSLVRRTDLITWVPLSSLRGQAGADLRVLPLAEMRTARTICLFTRPGLIWSPLMKELRAEFARESNALELTEAA